MKTLDNTPLQANTLEAKGILRERWLWVIIPLVSFCWFWFWRSNTWSGGDSEQWEREIYNGAWLRNRQMLSFAFMQAIYKITYFFWGWSSRLAINLASCFSGALAMLVVWRMFRGKRYAPWLFCVVVTAGFTTIFYGHLETYAHPIAALLLHLLAIQRSVEGKWRPAYIIATFCLVLFFHLAILFALPAVIFVALAETHRRELGWRGYFELIEAFVPGVLFWLLIAKTNYGGSEMVGEHFAIPQADLFRRPWLLFTDEMLPMKFWFMIWNTGVAAPLAIWIFCRALWRKPDLQSFYYLIYFCAFICFTLLWNPDMKERDFDLFCFPWVIATVVVAHRIMQLPARALWMGLLIGVNLNLWVIRPALWARVGQRETATILIDTQIHTQADPPYAGRILLDERLLMRDTNQFVPCGYHSINVHTTLLTINRIIFLEPGRVYKYLVDSDGVHLQPVVEK